MQSRWVWLVAVGAAIALAGCGGAGDAPDASGGSATIGPSGATVAGPEGSSVLVPAGAASAPVTVRIARDATDMPALPNHLAVVGDVWSVTPHGQVFESSVRVRLPPVSRPLRSDEVLRVAKISPGGEWALLSPEATAESLEVTTRSFSWFVPVAERFASPLGLTAPLALTVRSMTCDAGPCDALEPDASDVTLLLDANNGAVPQGCTDPRLRVVAVSSASPFMPSLSLAAIEPLQQALDLRTDQVRFRFRATAGSPTVQILAAQNRNESSASLTVQLVCAGPPQTTQSLAVVPIAFPRKSGSLTPPALGATVSDLSCNGRPCAGLIGPQAVALRVRLTAGAVLPLGCPSVQLVVKQAGNTGVLASASVPAVGSPPRVPNTGNEVTLANPITNVLRTFTVNPPVPLGDVALVVNTRCPADGSERELTSFSLPFVAAFQSLPPGFSMRPQPVAVRVGETASFTAVATGYEPPRLEWQSRAAGATAWSVLPGAVAGTFTTLPTTLSDNGRQFRVVATNSLGSAATDAVTLTVTTDAMPPVIGTQPAPLAVIAGSDAAFSVLASGSGALSYEWRLNGNPITGANAAVLRLSAVTASAAGVYSVLVRNEAGSVLSNGAALDVGGAGAPTAVAPSIVTAPAPVSVTAGSTATFAVGVAGTGPFSFQWRKDGVPIPGATSAVVTLAAASATDQGGYSVAVSNAAGSATSTAAELVVSAAPPAAAAPTIGTPPSSLVVMPGGSATLAVAASGSGPLGFVWRKDGDVVVGAIGPVLTIDSAFASNAGAYTVTVSNAQGSATSPAATLTVVGAPSITTQPVAQVAVAGGAATFAVAANGQALRYQWTRNGEAIVGATSASYTTPPLAQADSGAFYSVIVYNAAGLVTSRGAVLTVTPVPDPPGMVLFAGDFSSAGTATGTGTAARFDNPQGLTADAAGNLYVASSNGKFVSKIDPAAGVTHLFFAPITATSFFANPALAPDGSLFVGSYSWCGLWRATPPLAAPTAVAEITPANCPVYLSNGLSVDAQGRVAIADTSRHAIIIATQQPGGAWTQTYFAGGTNYFDANANRGSTDAAGTSARFSGPTGLAHAANGDLFVADHDNGTIRRITPAGEVSTFAGTAGQQSTLDGTGTAARFDRPYGLAFDPDGNLIVLTLGASAAEPAWVRRVTMGGVVTTLFDARAEAATLATDGNAVANARTVKGIAAPARKRIAISAGNAVLLRTLP